ncbi:palmitoyltransferase for Vac8p [Recurvomyces mirabilis]|uniref:palmitoyltransferase for Vac8p n=1 Tax=Recurvomyces mirabilis TaxID=574656 RepID=UPI002DDF3248|nr:palmitoyltransferase for Vac8p [Recurvomyces mirabilis]
MSRTTFDDMPTLTRPSPPASPRRRRHWAKKLERCCCQTFAYFPLTFVYGLTTWAVWVEVNVSFFGLSISGASVTGPFNWIRAVLGVIFWALANSSYTIAVFTSPGSPADERQDYGRRGRKDGGYEGLPTYEDEEGGVAEHAVPQGMTMVTAKSSGKPRYCKKCCTLKPDRAHHCSSCGSATWVWTEILDESQMQEGLKVVNTILLAVLGGIIGLVLSGFTGWHIYLVMSGQTTIESLEKTRYLSPLKKSMEDQAHRNYVDQANGGDGPGIADQLKEIHANALPGVLRPEEGEESQDPSRTNTPDPAHNRYSSTSSPAKDSLQRSYASMEQQRERDRYSAYLDEVDSEKMPNAFNLGWKRNLLHVFGETPLLWWLPVCNTTGDGWQWEVTPKWYGARDDLARQRAQREREEQAWGNGGRSSEHPPSFEPLRRDVRWTPGAGFVNHARNSPLQPPPRRSPLPSNVAQAQRSDSADLQMQTLSSATRSAQESDEYDTSSDEDVKRMYQHEQIAGITTENSNDVPDGFLKAGKGRSGERSRSSGRRKGD